MEAGQLGTSSNDGKFTATSFYLRTHLPNSVSVAFCVSLPLSYLIVSKIRCEELPRPVRSISDFVVVVRRR